MSTVPVFRAFRRLLASQSLEPAEIRSLQERKLRRVIRAAYDHVPYYRRLLDGAGLSPDHVSSTEVLSRIPISTKAELQKRGPDDLLDDRFDRAGLSAQMSSGSTGRPFTVYFDPQFRAARDATFLRALTTAGYRPGRKLLLLTSAGPARQSSPLLRWRYASIEDPVSRHRDLFLAFRPHILYGCTTAIRLLAEELPDGAGRATPNLISVITTAETLDGATRRSLQARFGCPVFDFYGLTETGLVGWECTAHRGYHLAEETTLVETVPIPGADASRLVMTSLEVRAMPFIRYDSGDIGELEDDAPCVCGRMLRRLRRVEGRVVDCITLEKGRHISPYRLTCALEGLGLQRYQVIQDEPAAFTVRVESGESGPDVPAEAIRAALHDIVGPAARIEIQASPRLAVDPRRKFRVVESHLERTTGP